VFKILSRRRCFFLFVQCLLIFFVYHRDSIFAHSPHDVIYQLAISPNYDQDQTLFTFVDHFLRSTDGGYSWKEIVNGLDYVDSLSDIAISPSFQQDKTMFVSSKGDGIYRSQDGGSSWVKVNTGLFTLGVNLLAVSPDYVRDETVLAAVAEGGLYQSKDGGRSWHRVLDDQVKITAVAFLAGQKRDQVLAGSNRGELYLSSDEGETWHKHFEMSQAGAITSIAVPPSTSLDRPYFIGTQNKGILKTEDGGATYMAMNKGLEKLSISFKGLKYTVKPITAIVPSPNYATDSIVFACTWDQAIFRSDDGGKTWREYSIGLTKSVQADQLHTSHFKAIDISKGFSQDETLFLAGFDGLFKSADGGHTWSQLESRPIRRVLDFAISPQYGQDATIALATYHGGAYMTENQGVDWKAINQGIQKTRVRNVAISPDFSTDGTMFAITSHVFYRSTDRGDSWQAIKIGRLSKMRATIFSRIISWLYSEEPTFPWLIKISPNFASDNTAYFATKDKGIFSSTDGGLSWSFIWDAFSERVTDMVISPDFASDKTLYATLLNKGLYQSTDGGQTWALLSIRDDWHNVGGDISIPGLYFFGVTISPTYKTDGVVFVGTSEGLFKTSDRGVHWQKLAGEVYGERGYIDLLAISPDYQRDQTLIINVKGKGLFKTRDGGANFVEIGLDLLANNYAVDHLAFSPTFAADNTLYASGEELFQSTDGGNTWRVVTRPVRYEDEQQTIHYQGRWKLLTGDEFSATSVTYSKTKGDKVEFTFVGTGVRWIGLESNNHGIAKVYLDGEFKDYVDQFSATQNFMTQSYMLSDLPHGPHHLTIEVTDTKNSTSRGYRIAVDGFDVFP